MKKVRIIGGMWKGYKVSFPIYPNLRPTRNKVKETLFNWINPFIEGSNIFDPFVGSGSLILEALSRGASEVLALDINNTVLKYLYNQLKFLNFNNNVKLIKHDAISYLRDQKRDKKYIKKYDIVFVDPPFYQGLVQPVCELLESLNWLSKNAFIYTESEIIKSNRLYPKNWILYREKKIGIVNYSLLKRTVNYFV